MRLHKWVRQILWGSAAAMLAGHSVPALSDDTEIYLSPPNSNTTPPLVMLSLDYRSNLGSTICNNTAAGQCTATDYFRQQGLTADLPPSGTLNFYEMLQLTLKLVLRKYPGVKIGLMLNHEEQNNCAGPEFGSNAPSSPANARCSNGGYIARRFLINNPANQSDLLAILKSIPAPSGSVDHKYQGKELFFELYRYLTGGLIYNGHNGWEDFTTDDSKNLQDPADGASIFPASQSSDRHDWDDTTSERGDETTPSNVTDPIETLDHTRYVAPQYGQCSRIFTINFLFSVSNQENDSDEAIRAPVANGGMGFNPGTSNSAFPNVLGYLNETDLAPSIPGFQNVTSFFLVQDVGGLLNQTMPYAQRGGTREPIGIGNDPRAIEAELDNIFSQILSVSTTFVAASIPVNVFNRSQAVDNVFLALFQAEEEPHWNGCLKKLRVKRSNIGTLLVDSLNDFDNPADTRSAFGADGRIRFDARTFWTRDGGTLMDTGDTNSDGVVDSRDAANNPVNPENYVSKRDGRVVDRGGSGQLIPGFINAAATGVGSGPGTSNSGTGARKLFYDATASSLAPLDATPALADTLKVKLDVANASATDTAAQELALAERVLQYIRGFDVGGPNGLGDGDNTTVSRRWMFADPLHSRPQPINYGSIAGYPAPTATPPNIPPPNRRPGIFIAVTSNDGFLRFIENTLPNNTVAPATGNAEPNSVQSGKELWAFMPQAAMRVQRLLMVNAPIPLGPGHPNYDPDFPTRPYSPHPYTIDGSPTVLVKDFNGDGTVNNVTPFANDKVYLFFGMRRGGRNYYGLDVTDPYSPTLMWTITGDTSDPAYSASINSSGAYAKLGRTFSQPRVGRVRVGTDLKDVLIFGGGYSNNKDLKLLGSNDTVGNAIFVVDATNGSLIWKATGGTGTSTSTHFQHASLEDSIPADVAAVDTDGDFENLIDRIVVGDTGGNVWRADLTGTNTSDWKLTRLANLGRHYISDVANDRRFLNRPDIVQDTDDIGPYDAVIIGSGDREDPLDLRGADLSTPATTENWLYVIKDRNIGVGAGANSSLQHGDSTLPDITQYCPPVTDGAAAAPCNAPGTAGWKLRLGEAVGEKNLAPAVTVSGTIFFTTYLKAGTTDAGTCGPNEGNGLLYAVKLANGKPAYNYDVVGSPEGDRTQALDSGGIPAQVVYLPPLEPCNGANCPTPPPACLPTDEECLERERCKNGGDIILPDGSVQKLCPLPARPTFWRRRED